MKLSIESFFNDRNAPLYQAGFMLLVILVGNILVFLIESSGIKTFDELFPWVISGAMLLAFSLMNTLIGLNTDSKMIIYYGKSLIGFVSLAFGASVMAKTFSSYSLGEAGSMWWIYIVITIGYLIFLGMMMFMKTVVTLAQKEDENLRQNK
jgi:hypothetical protein